MAGGIGQPNSQEGGNGGPNGAQNGQLQRELAQRLNDLQNLRGELARQGRDVSELDHAIGALRGLTGGTSSMTDERALKTLQTQVEAMKEFEFQLTRAVIGEKEGVRVARVGDVPPAYRQWVNDYYKEIGKTPAAKAKPPK